MAESALKKGEPKFALFKAISSGIKWNIQPITETTDNFRKVQLLLCGVCKQQGTMKDETFKKQQSFCACTWTLSFLLNTAKEGMCRVNDIH